MPNRTSGDELAADCPCPRMFQAVAYCPDCPYRATQEKT